MNEEIFRKKSLDKLKSPENLNDYIRVTNPAVWLLLAAVIVLLIGVVIWGIFGHIETVVQGDIHIKDGEAFCYIANKDISSVKEGDPIRADDVYGQIAELMPQNGYAVVEIELPDGHYDAEIIVESINPLSFVLN